MKRTLIAAAAALTVLTVAPTGAQARFYDRGLDGPKLVEEAQVVVRERVIRPGRRVVRERFVRPGRSFVRERCRVVRERIVRPNGRVIVRSERRCR